MFLTGNVLKTILTSYFNLVVSFRTYQTHLICGFPNAKKGAHETNEDTTQHHNTQFFRGRFY